MSAHEPNPTPGVTLSDADQRALDALLDAAFELDHVPADLRERARRVGALMGLLDTDAPSVDLTARTMAHISAAAGRGGPALSENDRRAIDHLAQNDWDAARLAEDLRPRARRAVRLLDNLRVEGVTSDDAADLADRTMDLIAIHAERARMAPALDLGPAARRGFRLADLVSVAAMVLIGVAIFWPILGGMRHSMQLSACEQNLHNSGVGFGMHASDNAGRLPMNSASLLRSAPGKATWWNVGAPETSHSANLYQLVEGGFTLLEDLACPGNHDAPITPRKGDHDWRSASEVSYSYQLFGGRQRPRLSDRTLTVILTDKSPVIDRARRGERVYAQERSHNHGGSGQHVLFANGSVQWLADPVTEQGDNLWLPAELSGVEGARLNGTELPVRPGDVFVGP